MPQGFAASSRSSTLLVFRMEIVSFSHTHSQSEIGASWPRSNPERTTYVEVWFSWRSWWLGGGTCQCLHVRRTWKNKMLRRLVVACAVRTHRRLLFGAVKLTGQKQAVDHSELSDGHAIASGTALPPVTLQIGLTCQSAMCGWVRIQYVVGMELLLFRPPNQNLHRCQVDRDRGLRDIGAPLDPKLPVYSQVCLCVESTTRGRWRFCWWRTVETKLSCTLSQIYGPDLWIELQWETDSR